jgi:integrase
MSKKRKFTDLMLDRLPAAPKGKRLELRDETLTGLWLRVTDSGVKSWSIMYELGGRSRRHTLGTFPKFNVKAARAAAKAAFRQIADGVDPGEQKRFARDKTVAPDSLEVAAETWLGEGLGPKRKPWRPTTAKEWRRIMQRNVLPVLGRRLLTSITKRELEALVETIAARAPIQANRVHSVLSRFFAWATKRNYVGVSPMVGIDKPSHEAERDRVLKPRELAAFWRASTALGYPFGPLFHLLALTWARREMIRALEWNWVDFDERRIAFPRGIMKMDREFTVHLSDSAIEILRKVPRIDGSPYVFPATRRVARKGKEPPKGHVAVSGFSRATDRVRELMEKELGKIEPFTLHNLRHTAATIAAEKLKIAPQIVDKILAHDTITGLSEVAKIYQKAEWLEERAAALDAWARYIHNLVEPDKADRNVISFAVRG